MTVFSCEVRTIVAMAVLWSLSAFAAAAERPPNIILILCDNLGYGDIGCFGSELHRTPQIDQLASEGMMLTSFYSASGVCTPSRASLMTGCYPRRVGMDRTDPDGAVLRPVSPNGLHPDEITIAEQLRQGGYATTCIGKWHLGDQPPFLPTRQGFDEYFGIPYSDDMTPRTGQIWPELPLLRGERVVEAPVDRDLLTRRYTEEAVRFMTAHRERPFFLYLPHAMPGSTRHPFASDAFRGRSRNGPYGDSVEEIDWSTGEIVKAVRELGLAERTLIIWTSDNGAPRRDPPQGTNRPLGGWGYSTMEGGMRVPCIAWWPGHIPAGTRCDAVATMMDWLPTCSHLADTPLPSDRSIDGHNIWPLLSGDSNTSPYEAFFYYYTDQLHAVRAGKWKLHLPLEEKQINLQGRVAGAAEAELYDLSRDLGESQNVAKEHPEVVQQLLKLADRMRGELGEGSQRGPGTRPAGRVEQPVPLRL